MSRKWHDKRVMGNDMSSRKINHLKLAVGSVLLFSFVRTWSSTAVFVAARTPPRTVCVPWILDSAECMLLIEPSYFDSMTIFRAPDPSSVFEAELRVCGVPLARPIL